MHSCRAADVGKYILSMLSVYKVAVYINYDTNHCTVGGRLCVHMHPQLKVAMITLTRITIACATKNQMTCSTQHKTCQIW